MSSTVAVEFSKAPNPPICPTGTASGMCRPPPPTRFAAHILPTITQMKGRNAAHSHLDKFHLFYNTAQTSQKESWALVSVKWPVIVLVCLVLFVVFCLLRKSQGKSSWYK